MLLDHSSKLNPSIIAVIPAYNESVRIADVIKETKKYVNMVIVVDDGSSDHTAAIATSLQSHVIRHTHNMGKGAALKSGLRECLRHNPDFVVTLDADGQHDPADIPGLLEPLQQNHADVTIGSRFIDNASSIPSYRQAGLSFIGFLDKYLTNNRIKDTQSGFRAYAKSALHVVSEFNSTGYGVETEQLSIIDQYGLRVIELPITIKYRGLTNTSKRHPLRHGTEIVSSILKVVVEKRPLMSFGIIGIFFLCCSIVAAIDLIHVFNKERYFSIPLSIITLGLSIIGLMFVIAGIVLYSNNKVRDRINALRRDILASESFSR